MSEASASSEQHAAAGTAAATRRRLTGLVTSNKMAKTVTVLVEHKVKHPLYGKYVTRSKKYHAHDDSDAVEVGDTVLIEECAPISKTKAWRVVRLLEKAREA